jgi:hypothetical protein
MANDPLRQKWQEELQEKISAAREASQTLERRLPRVALLFEYLSSTYRSAHLTGATFGLFLDGDEKYTAERDASVHEKLKDADGRLTAFSHQAREALLASPWSVRPVLISLRRLRRRTRRYLPRSHEAT